MTLDDLPLFDPALGAQLRDQGMQLASDNEADQRRELARQALHDIAKSQYRLWHDHLWEALDDLGIGDFNPPAIGAIWRHGITQGWIERTNEDPQPSRRAKAHTRPGPVYRSRIFDAF